MNKKMIAIIILAGLLVILGGVGFILLSSGDKEKAQTTVAQEQPALNSEQKQIVNTSPTPSSIGHVSYDGKTFTPKTLNLKKGSTIEITNTTNKKIAISIIGKRISPVLYVEPNTSNSYSNLGEDLEYSFKDITKEVNNLPKPINQY